MSFQEAHKLTHKFYGNYPGPTEDTYNLAMQVADYFESCHVKNTGVIGVAKCSEGLYHLGLSPDLQAAVMTCMAGLQDKAKTMWNAHFRLGSGLKEATGTRFDLCRKVADNILLQVGSDNPGCAEKKIVTNVLRSGAKIAGISVVPYPDTQYATGLPAQMVGVSADGAYIAPCKTCLAIYHG